MLFKEIARYNYIMKYKCVPCNFLSHEKYNFDRHLISQKHITNTNGQQSHINENDNQCAYCERFYTNKNSLLKHKKLCLEKKTMENSYKNQIEELQTLLIQKDEIIKRADETIKRSDEIIKRADERALAFKAEVCHLKSIVNNTSVMTKSCMSTISYIAKNYSDALPLISLTDYVVLKHGQNDLEFVENLITEQNRRTLDSYLGNFIVKTYKKKDMKQQSIWNSDTTRLTFFIKQIITNEIPINNDDVSNNNLIEAADTDKILSEWIVDKKGIIAKKIIIAPIIDYIKPFVEDYIQKFDVVYKEELFDTFQYCIHKQYVNKKHLANEIIQTIENGSLIDDILRHIAPFFYLNKSSEIVI